MEFFENAANFYSRHTLLFQVMLFVALMTVPVFITIKGAIIDFRVNKYHFIKSRPRLDERIWLTFLLTSIYGAYLLFIGITMLIDYVTIESTKVYPRLFLYSFGAGGVLSAISVVLWYFFFRPITNWYKEIIRLESIYKDIEMRRAELRNTKK